jgi:hypothetical protein
MRWPFTKKIHGRMSNLVASLMLLVSVTVKANDLTYLIPGSLAAQVLIDSRASTNGFDPTSGLCLQETVGGYRWNPKLWLYKFPEITSINSGLGIGALGQAPGTYGMHLITRRHAIQANHIAFANPVGSPVTFTDKRGVVFTNYVQSMTNFGFDINVIQFSNAFPKQFVPFQLMPTNFANYLPGMTNGRANNFKLPVVVGTYDRHLYFMSLVSVFSDAFGGISTKGIYGNISFDGGSVNGSGRWLTNQIGYGWGQTAPPYYIKMGDSSSPIMMIRGKHLVLLSSIYTYGNAPDYASAAPTIQACVDTLTVTAGGTKGQYKIKICDLSSFPLYP